MKEQRIIEVKEMISDNAIPSEKMTLPHDLLNEQIAIKVEDLLEEKLPLISTLPSPEALIRIESKIEETKMKPLPIKQPLEDVKKKNMTPPSSSKPRRRNTGRAQNWN